MFDGHYIMWNHKKTKAIIDYFGFQNFSGKTILDLGCGYGDIGNAFGRLGSKITAVDARQDHIDIAKKKHNYIKFIKDDLDYSWQFKNQLFDYILDLSILCHLKNWEEHLINVCKSCENLVLETEVADSFDENFNQSVQENKAVYDWAMNGFGSRPSAANIEKILRRCGMSFKRLDDPKLNTGPYKYDWKEQNIGVKEFGTRRIWFAKKTSDFTPQVITPNNFAQSVPVPNPTASIQLPTPKLSNKTAICLSGYLRNFLKTFQSLQANVISKFDGCDIFIHTFDKIGSQTMSVQNTNQIRSKIEEFYKPVSLKIDPVQNFNNPNVSQENMEKLFSIYTCNEIKCDNEQKCNFIYNTVIRCNADSLFENSLDFNSLSKSAVNISDIQNAGYDSTFAVSDSRLIDLYSYCYDFLSNYNLKPNMTLDQILKIHLDNFNIPVIKTPIRVNSYVR